jgi:type I restriction enzyme M protein
VNQLVNGGVEKLAASGLKSPQALNEAVWRICDVLRSAGVGSALRYVPELTWILFLRVLDEQEAMDREEADALGLTFSTSVVSPYRWQDWAAPWSDKSDAKTFDGKPLGWKRRKLQEGKRGDYFAFVNGELLPYLRGLRDSPGATAKQRIISEILSPIKQVSIDTESNFADVLDRVHALHLAGADPQHQFMLSQVYEGLLIKMGEKNSDGGQFYTPRELIRAMVRVIDPKIGQTICDPCCGTGGFLAESAEHVRRRVGELTTDTLDALKHRTFYGREKDNLAYPIALANLMLHGVDEPHLWHGNTLTRQTIYGGLWEGAPERFHVVLTNPPFGGKEGKEAQTSFPFKTRATQVLFLQYVMQILEPGGRCGIVLDEGLLYRTSEEAFAKTKRKLLDECDVWCVVSLPGGAFTGSGAGVKANLVFFTKGRKTERIWYYDLSHIKVGKKTPLTLQQFATFFDLLDKRGTPEAETEHSWTVEFAVRKRHATDEAALHRREADAQRERALTLREQAKAFRKVNRQADADALQPHTETAERQAREATARAEAIEDAIYDLKAVNPREKKRTDNRAPADLLMAIADRGREVDAALQRLRSIL